MTVPALKDHQQNPAAFAVIGTANGGNSPWRQRLNRAAVADPSAVSGVLAFWLGSPAAEGEPCGDD